MEAKREQKMRDAGYTRRPTLREMAEPVQEPEQEPVAYVDLADGSVIWKRARLPGGSLLYTHPPRQWQGLTEEEVFHVENNVPDSVISDRQWTVYFASALDAALRRKNHE
jgi:hypothetical protein